ncbi:MAG: hypothetical protein ACOYLX_08375 [Burkholderiaceae bacterium]
MRTERRVARGQALVELLVAMLAFVPLYFAVAWLGNVLELRLATISAARSLAFECTVRIEACTDADAHPELATEVRRRVFGRGDEALRTEVSATGPIDRAEVPSSWVDRRGDPLLERWEDVTVEVTRERFDSPLAFAGGLGAGAADAVRRLSDWGGPGRFGLAIDGGLVAARVETRIARRRPEDGWISGLLALPLVTRARLAILTDAWNASGPYGDAPDSVETRVAGGARVPGLESAIDAAWLPVRGLLAVAGAIGFESSARAMRWREVDVDLVPADRLGGDRPAARSTPTPTPDSP